MDIIKTKSLGKDFAEVQEIVLEDTSKTRIVFKPFIHSEGVKGEIIRYKKDKQGKETIESINFNELHAGDGIKIELHTKALNILIAELEKVKQLQVEKGVSYGTNEYRIVDANDIVIDDKNKIDVIRKILESDYEEEVWEQLSYLKPKAANKYAYAKIQEERVHTLELFEKMLKGDNISEDEWQSFFEKNTWIFGYGLRYQVLKVIQAQPNYGGAMYTGTGNQRGDFLTATDAEAKFTCLVEIKKPDTKLLQNAQYRNGAWGASKELSGAVAQIQVNCAQWEKNHATDERYREVLQGIHTFAPRGIVVIGKTSELNDYDKKNSFERFRTEIRNPEIITFDELYERAKFIVGEYEKDK